MKRCPECRRDYYDDSLMYCLDDGSALLEGPASVGEAATAILSDRAASAGRQNAEDGPQTAILHDTAPPSEDATRAQIHTTEQTDVFPSGIREIPKRSFDKRLLAAPFLLATIVLGGFFGYRYFSSSNQISSIAVMPFVNESGNSDVDYLSDGMTETLISNLSQLPQLNVKPRSMVFRYKGKDVGPDTIGKELGVQAVLLGRVLQRGSDLSLFVELIDVASTKVLWSRQYGRHPSDLVALQGEIARDVSTTIKSGLSGEEERRVTQTGTNDPEAYRLYLLGRSLVEKRKERDALKAIDAFEQAIALDPNYAAAYRALAGAHSFTALYGSVPVSEALPKNRAALLRARELAPDMPVHVGLAAAELFMARNFAASEREVQKALELNPNNAEAHRFNGLRLAFLGRVDEASAAFRRAVDLDPTNVNPKLNYAWSLFYLGRLDESDAEVKAAQQLEPGFWIVEYQMFVNSRGRRDHSAAVEHLARALDLRDEAEAARFIRDSFRSGGWTGMMRTVIANPERSKVWPYYVATFAAELGEKDTAFAFLDKAADKYDQFALFAKIDPAMEPLRGDPRYGGLLKKLGLQ
jgi:eukaryotic-like serine/threonine-protein kinase